MVSIPPVSLCVLVTDHMDRMKYGIEGCKTIKPWMEDRCHALVSRHQTTPHSPT